MKKYAILTSLFLLVFSGFVAGQIAFSPQKIISDTSFSASSVYTADFDGDGDLDVVASSHGNNKVAWYKNSDGQGNFNSEIMVTDNVLDVRSVYAADIDNDGDMDVLSASMDDNKIAWYENVNGDGYFSGQNVITTNAAGAVNIKAADIDGDGDQDVISASYSDYKIAWYRNEGDGNFSTQNIISENAMYAECVFIADINNDDYLDVISASAGDDKIAWYKNIDGNGNFSDEIIISTNADYAISVCAADIDNDGDLDVVSASREDHKIAWYENTDGSGAFSSENVISNEVGLAKWAHATDLNHDGHIDVLVGSKLNNSVSWFRNEGNGVFSSEIVISNAADNISKVFSADLDNDGDLDVLSSSIFDNKVAWYENIKHSDIKTSNHAKVMCYPNPTTGLIHVDFDGGQNTTLPEINIMDVSGKLVWQDSAYNNNIIDLNKLDSGIYFIKVTIEGKTYNSKIIKQ